jgi:hypothetical protein
MRVPRRSALALSIVLGTILGAAAGCTSGAGSGLDGAGTPAGNGGGGGPGSDSPLVGRWRHQLLFVDGMGIVRGSVTIWRFAADSTATKTVIATNFSAGLEDTLISNATWSVTGSSVDIRFLLPDTGTVRFDWRVERIGADTILTLSGTDFARIGS